MLGLVAHGRGSGGGLFDQRGVLLCHLIEVGHCLVDLRDAIALLVGRRRDFADQVAHALHAGDDFGHALAGLRHLLRARFDILDRGTDQRLDLLGGFGAALRQRTHFACHHGKTAALLASARCFDGGVERQDVGLESDRIDHTNDVGNLARAVGDVLHAGHHLAHHFAAARGGLGCVGGELVGLACGIGRLRHGGGQLFHAGCGLFEVGRRLLGTRRQVLVARSNLRGRR